VNVAEEAARIDGSWPGSSAREDESTLLALPAIDGRILKIRKASTPDDVHRDIYRVLQISPEIMKPVKTWTPRR
jgi:hypothetical protein